MKVSISDARRRLPALVKALQKDPLVRVEITVRDEAVAELRAAQPSPEPGEAARKLLELRRRLARRRLKAGQGDVSMHVKEHLYGPKGAIG